LGAFHVKGKMCTHYAMEFHSSKHLRGNSLGKTWEMWVF
jgi:hypothetical protein